jgi:hypothetical protein
LPMLTNRNGMCLALLSLLLLWAPSTTAQQQPSYAAPYSPPRDDAYRPTQKPAYGQPYQAQPYPGQPYQAQPYQGQQYQAQPYQGQPYQGQPYQAQPYQGQPYQGQPYQAQPYQGQPYQPDNYSQPSHGQKDPYGPPPGARDNTYSSNEIIEAGHSFFGATTMGLARVVEYAFQKQGRPNGYILGQDAGGAFVAGLRYGEGMLYTRDAGNHRVYWQGPSIGWDMGGDGSKVMVLVYNLSDPSQIYRRFGGIDGSAYVVGGVGLTFQKNSEIVTAPIRTGLGLRLGANVGYLKYTRAPTWNPF